MIRFTLLCRNDHRFEAWFKGNQTCEEQLKSGDVHCPFCGDSSVRKAPMAPNVITSKGRSKAKAQELETEVDISPLPDVGIPESAEAITALAEKMTSLMHEVQENYDYVGEDFPDEVRKIHYGEAEDRGIYGETSADEVEALLEEGVEILPLPVMNKPKTSH